MTTAKPSIAIIGAGMGGLTLAASLRLQGIEDVRIYEQASRFTRIGAGIQMLPNAMTVLRRLGIEERLRSFAFLPTTHLNRAHTGEILNELPLPEARYNAPYFCMHRGDLHEALLSVVPSGSIELGKKLTNIEQHGSRVTLAFADGSSAEADGVIGADGLHSVVRTALLGAESPRFSGRVAYRGVYDASLIGRDIGNERTKWWGPDRHIVIYYTKADHSEIYFVTSVPEQVEWMTAESWSARGDVNDLRAAFETFHEDVRDVLGACPDCHKWAILDRDPLPKWTEGHITLLGDACHPMTPYMAQGAATSMEDAAVLSRCIAETEGIGEAFKIYETHRKPRTSLIQAISKANTWQHGPSDNPDWLYGYDSWNIPLTANSIEGSPAFR